MAVRHTPCIVCVHFCPHQIKTPELSSDQIKPLVVNLNSETLEGVVHQVQVEVRKEMAVLKVLLPQPAVARARSGVTATTSESTVKPQFWLESTFALITQGFSRQLADILVALLTPSAVLALAMALWRVSADLGWTGAFLIADGLFSHWQVWIALSIGLKLISSTMIAWGSRTSKFSEEN